MSFPNKEREDRIRERMAQATAAALSGDGWVQLGKTWNMTAAGALTWCRSHVPKEIMQQIGKNGYHRRTPRSENRERHYEGGRLVLKGPPRTQPRRFVTCQHWFYRDRQAVQCGAPTENGKPTCKACLALEMKGTGRTRKDMIFSVRSSRISA